MRNNTILMAVLIAIAAGGFGFGLNAYLQDNKAPAVADETAATDVTNNDVASNEVTTSDVTNTATDAAANTAVNANNAANAQAANTQQDQAAATSQQTQGANEQTDTQNAMTMVDLDQVALNDAIPAAGSETGEAAASGETQSDINIDVKDALEDRSLGSDTAPLTIYDYSSLTCPHCATFHKTIFPRVKEQLIDTGKVRWVFAGFPLNEPSLKAEMVARCAPKDQYAKLIDLMFQTQPRWAFDADPIATLSLIVKSAGISEEMFLACINNKELEAGMYEKARQASEKHNISSTPTFIFNDGAKKISGVGSVEGFIYDAERFIRESQQSTPSSALTEDTAADQE